MFTRLVNAAYQFAQHLTSYSNPFEAPSEETMSVLTSLFRTLATVDCQVDGESSRSTDINETLILKTLEEIPEPEDVLQVVDGDKYNLLQKAIIWNKVAVVKALLHRGCGCSDSNNCDGNKVVVGGEAEEEEEVALEDINRPLHLACFLGRTEIVKLLLRGGADPTLQSSLSLAAPFGPEELVPEQFIALRSNRLPPKKLAYHFAVCGDHVEVLQTLFDWEQRMLLTSMTGREPAAPLFVACKAGARKCLLFMLEQSYSSTIVNAVNEEGFTPLHLAVVRGKWFCEKLLQKGADVSPVTSMRQNVLHRLFAVDGKLHPEFYAITQLLLDVGIHREINTEDRHGYTPLLLLLYHLNCCWNSEDEVKECNDNIIKCVELMLNYGADPNVQCSTGHSALHVLLHRNLFHYSSPLAIASTRTDVSGIEAIRDILRILIEKGSADVNLRQKDGLTNPILSWVFALQTGNISPEELLVIRDPFLSSLDLLLLSGADPNGRSAFALSPLSSMISWCQLWMSRGQSTSVLSALPVVEEILSKLFRRNARILSVVRVEDRYTLYNTYQSILSMCLNIDPRYLVIVSRLTTYLMLWGLQSELYLPPHFFDDSSTATASTSSSSTTSIKRHVLFQFLKIGLLFPRLVNFGSGYENCLRLFCNFTETSTMHSCFQTALRLSQEMSEDGGGGAPAFMGGENVMHPGQVIAAIQGVGVVDVVPAIDTSNESKGKIVRLLYEYSSNAETLKVLTRKTIIKSLNGKIPLKAPQLELPNSLTDYIMDLST